MTGTPRTEGRIRVVMAGPLEPTIGGMTSVIANLRDSGLSRKAELVFFDTRKTTKEGRAFREGVRSKLSLWRRWLRALEGRGTIAHIHTCSGLSYFLDGVLVFLARLRGVPVILHIHGARFDSFLESLAWPAALLARRIASLCSNVIVLSEEWRRKLAPMLPGARLVVLENGVRVSSGTRNGTADSKTVKVLFLGNLGKRKGVWELLKAAEDIHEDFVLQLVGGEEDPGISEQLRAYVREHGLQQRIVLLGSAVGAEKDRRLAEADIFVLPSHAEGLPVALLEAMASGLPSISTPVGAIGSVIRDGETGLLVAPGDVGGLGEALRRLIRDPGLRSRLGEAGRLACARRFGIEEVADRLFEIYVDTSSAAAGGSDPSDRQAWSRSA